MYSKRTSSIRVALVAICAIMIFSGTAIADETNGRKIGISAAIQTSQLDLMFPVWTSPKFVLVPSVALVKMTDVGTDIGLGMLFRFNTREGKVVPYFGFRGVAFIYSSDEPAVFPDLDDDSDSTTDFVVGPALGGEYFFDDNFSVGIEGQVNVSISDENSFRFGNPDGVNFNTATMLTATIYF